MSQIADYELLQLLGRGSQGTTSLAAAPSRLGTSDAQVAVKVLDQHADREDFRRVVEVLQVASGTRSSDLAALLDAGIQEGRIYYAMEYYPRGSLGRPAAALDRAHVLRAVAAAARGAHALHEAGLAHRNIKPTNILLTEDAGRLSDVGLAHVLTPGRTLSSTKQLDTVEYLDPVVVRGDRASRATDIWALGACLHTALTGRSLYGQVPPDILAALRMVMSTRPTIDASLDAAARAVVEHCLAPDPANRPLTAEQLAQEVETLLVGA